MALKVDQRLQAGLPAVTQTVKASFQPLPYLLLLPSLAIIFIIEFYPFINGVSFSFHKGTLLGTGAFVGLTNYLRLFNSPSFYNSLWFSFIFAFFNVLVSYVLGLALALFLNLDFPGRVVLSCGPASSLDRAGRSFHRQLEMAYRRQRRPREYHPEFIRRRSYLFPER